jgi:mevalonate kinase
MTRLLVPGKVMLSGEYGVLSGGLATMLPLPRYMELTIAANAPADPYPPIVEKGRQYFLSASENHEREHGVPHIAIDRSAFDAEDPLGRPRKLGIGSSAAEAAGVLGLRLLNAGARIGDQEAQFVEDVMSLHHRAQGELGSGADAAVCSLGRPVLFRGGDSISVELLPRGTDKVPLNLVWSGEAANSRELIDRFLFWQQNEPYSESLLRELHECSDYLGRSWFVSEQAELFGMIDAHNAILKEISKLAGITYFMPVHIQLDAWARRHGGRAKPTGAGGGDMVLLAGDLPIEQLQRLCIPLRVDELFNLTTITQQLDLAAEQREAQEAAAQLSETDEEPG